MAPVTNQIYTQRYVFENSHYASLREVIEVHSVPRFVHDAIFTIMRNHLALGEISDFKCFVYTSLTSETSHLWVMLEWNEGGDLEIVCLNEVERDGFCNCLMHSGMGKRGCEEGKMWVHSSVGWNVCDWDALQSLFLASQHATLAQIQPLETPADSNHIIPGSPERYSLNQYLFNNCSVKFTMKDLLSRPHRYEETMNLFSEVRGYLEDRSSTTCTIDSSIRLLTFQRQILERTAEARNLWLVGLGHGIGLDG